MAKNTQVEKFHAKLLQEVYDLIKGMSLNKQSLIAFASVIPWLMERKYDFSLNDLQKASGTSRPVAARIWSVLVAIKFLKPTRVIGHTQLARRTKQYTNIKASALASALRYSLAERGLTADSPTMKNLLKFSQKK